MPKPRPRARFDRRAFLAAAGAVAGILLPTLAHAQTTLRFSSFEPPVAFITKEILTPWSETVSKASEGTLKIDMFPGGTLGRDPAAQLKLAQDGVVDIAWVVAGYTPGRFDDTTVVELPFLTNSTREGALALTRLLEKGKLRGFDGIRVLGLFATPTTEIHSTMPVTKPDDLKGRKFRAAGPNQLAMLTGLGAIPVGGIAGPAIAENMQRKMIDGTLNEWNAVSSFRIAEVAKYHLRVPMGSTTFMVVMNKTKYDALPPAAKAAIDKNAGEGFARVFAAKIDAYNGEVAAKVAADGKHTTVVPDAASLDAWRKALANVEAEWVKGDPVRSALLAAFKAELGAIRAGQ
jgi:TRAP-type C4-dicarboxylate transport system substrate-binding protein